MFSDISQRTYRNGNGHLKEGTPSTSTEQNPEIVYENPGTYDVLLIVTNEAGSNSLLKQDYIIVNDLTGTTLNLETSIKVFPNPARSFVRIESPAIINQLTVTNILGETVGYELPHAQSTQLQTSALTEGIYFLKIETDSGIITRKLQILK
ncbi:MAG: T9SS type A sorting domain-containing protein [Bacteroidales bacterium]